MCIRKGATCCGSISANKNKAFPHNCMGRILSTGIVGNEKLNKEINPLKKTNPRMIIIYLFI
jgi:hypothetical protein